VVKKGWIKGVSLLTSLALTVVTGCSSSTSNSSQGSDHSSQTNGSGKQVVVDFWNGHTGPDGKVMGQLVDEFQKSHPDIKINVQVLPWDEMFTKAQLAAKGGSGPDLVTLPLDRMIVYKDTLFKPVDDLVKGNINAADFDPNLWDKTFFDKKQYGIPLDTHPYALYYRKDLVEKAGLPPLPKDRPLTREEFEKYAKALSQGDVKGFAFKQTAVHAWWDTEGFLLQNGGSVLNADQTKSQFNSPAAKEVIQYLTGLRDNLKVTPSETLDWKTAFARFNDGKVAMLLHGSWLIPGLEESKVPYDTAMVPQLFTKSDYSTFANMHMFAFTRKDDAKTKAAMEFVKWIEQTENATKWGKGAGNVPANLKARAEYAKDPKFAPLAKTAEMMKGKLFMYPYNKNNDTMVYKTIIPNLEAIYNGSTPLDDGLKQIDDGINQVLK
jgi:multiple sugar transport system substrate-binding protein